MAFVCLFDDLFWWNSSDLASQAMQVMMCAKRIGFSHQNTDTAVHQFCLQLEIIGSEA